MLRPPTIYFYCDNGTREVHVIGPHVAVCWNLNDDSTRDGEPYIAFVQVKPVTVVTDGNGLVRDQFRRYVTVVTEDIGGMDSKTALEIMAELSQATLYLFQKSTPQIVGSE